MTQPDSRLKRIAPWVVLAIGLIAVAVVVVYALGSWLIIGALSEGPFEVAVRTWRDDNGDGVWDQGEPPVAYVNVHLEDVTHGKPLARWVTDENGVVVFGGMLQPKRTDVYEVYAEAPPGYALIGPERVRVDFGKAEKTPIDVGLALLPGWPAPTPRPAVALDCRLIYEGSSENDYVGAMALAPGLEGSVVMTLDYGAGIRRYAAGGALLEAVPAAPSVTSRYSGDYPRAVAGPDGRLWAWGSDVADGLAVFDGTEWHTVAPYEHPGAGEHRVYDLAIAADGAVWLGSDLGALRLDETTGQWTRHAAYQPIGEVMPTPEGTIWLLACARMSQCVPGLIRLTPGGPQLYEESPMMTLERAPGNVWGAASDGSGIWVIHELGLARWDIAAAAWTLYTAETTDNALTPAAYISAYGVAPDGALWLAMSDETFSPPRLQFGEQRFAFTRARPPSGEWHFASSPLLDGQYIDSVVVAGDGSVWASLRHSSTVYRCQ